MKTRKNLDGKNNVLFTIAAFVVVMVLSLFSSCTSWEEEEGGTTIIEKEFLINEKWDNKDDGSTDITLTGNCIENGKIVGSDVDVVNVKASISYEPDYILFLDDNGQLPAIVAKPGKDRVNGIEIANTDMGEFGDFNVASDYNRKKATVYGCDKSDTRTVGFIPETEFIFVKGALQKDTTINKKIYDLYYAQINVVVRCTSQREYDSRKVAYFRIASPKGVVPEVVTYEIRNVKENGTATDNTIPMSYDLVKFVDGVVADVTTINLAKEPENYLRYTRASSDTTIVVSAWPTLQQQATSRNGFSFQTNTNVTYRNFSVDVETKTVTDKTSGLPVILSASADIFKFEDKGIGSGLIDAANEGNYEVKYYVSSVQISVLGYNAMQTAKVTLKKSKAADVEDHIFENYRPTGADNDSITVTYDIIKTINGERTNDKSTGEGKISWDFYTSDITLTVDAWPTLQSLTAARNGLTFTTKTNVTNRDFVVTFKSRTIKDKKTGKNVTLTVKESDFSFTDKGTSNLMGLANEGDFERKYYTSTVEVAISTFSTSKFATIILKKEKAADVTTHDVRNGRITGVTANIIKMSYDLVTLVNGVETNVVTLPGADFGYVITANGKTLIVNAWPSLSQQAANRSGFNYTTKTNVTTCEFGVNVDGSKTITDPTSGKTITLSVNANDISFTDQGNSAALIALSDEGNYERKYYTSTIGVNISSYYSTSTFATVILKKEKVQEDEDDNDDYSMRFAGLSIFFDASVNHHVSAVMIYNATKSGANGGIRAAHDGNLLSETWDWTKVLKPEELPSGTKYSVITINGKPTPAYMEGTGSSLVWKSALRTNAGTAIYSVTKNKVTDKGFFNGDIALTRSIDVVGSQYEMRGYYSKTTDNKSTNYETEAFFPKVW